MCALATRLVDDLGVAKGDRVAIAMRNYPEWSVAFFAATMVGAVAAPLNAFWNGSELAFGVTDCGAEGARRRRRAARAARAHVSRARRRAPRRHPTRRPEGQCPDSRPASVDFADARRSHATGRRHGCPSRRGRRTGGPRDALLHVGHPGTAEGRARDPPQHLHEPRRASCTSPPVNACARARRCRPSLRPARRPAYRSCSCPCPLFHATGCHSILVSQAYFGRHARVHAEVGSRGRARPDRALRASRAFPASPR